MAKNFRSHFQTSLGIYCCIFFNVVLKSYFSSVCEGKVDLWVFSPLSLKKKNQAALLGHFGPMSTALCWTVEDVVTWGVFWPTVWRGVRGDLWAVIGWKAGESLWFVRWCPGQCPWSSLIEAWFLPLRLERQCEPVLMHQLGLHKRTFQICAKTKQLLFFKWDFAIWCCLWVLLFFFFVIISLAIYNPKIVQFTHVCRMNFIPHL